jgi:hypothetical protein
MIDIAANATQTVPTVEADAYASIVVPTGNAMYHTLAQMAKEVVSLGQTSAVAYKRTFAAFTSLLSYRPGSGAAVALPIGTAVVRAPAPKPVKKRGRPSNESLVNMSALARKNAVLNVQRHCSLCKEHGIDADDHRKGSKCPYYVSKQ